MVRFKMSVQILLNLRFLNNRTADVFVVFFCKGFIGWNKIGEMYTHSIHVGFKNKHAFKKNSHRGKKYSWLYNILVEMSIPFKSKISDKL